MDRRPMPLVWAAKAGGAAAATATTAAAASAPTTTLAYTTPASSSSTPATAPAAAASSSSTAAAAAAASIPSATSIRAAEAMQAMAVATPTSPATPQATPTPGRRSRQAKGFDKRGKSRGERLAWLRRVRPQDVLNTGCLFVHVFAGLLGEGWSMARAMVLFWGRAVEVSEFAQKQSISVGTVEHGLYRMLADYNSTQEVANQLPSPQERQRLHHLLRELVPTMGDSSPRVRISSRAVFPAAGVPREARYEVRLDFCKRLFCHTCGSAFGGSKLGRRHRLDAGLLSKGFVCSACLRHLNRRMDPDFKASSADKFLVKVQAYTGFTQLINSFEVEVAEPLRRQFSETFGRLFTCVGCNVKLVDRCRLQGPGCLDQYRVCGACFDVFAAKSTLGFDPSGDKFLTGVFDRLKSRCRKGGKPAKWARMFDDYERLLASPMRELQFKRTRREIPPVASSASHRAGSSSQRQNTIAATQLPPTMAPSSSEAPSMTLAAGGAYTSTATTTARATTSAIAAASAGPATAAASPVVQLAAGGVAPRVSSAYAYGEAPGGTGVRGRGRKQQRGRGRGKGGRTRGRGRGRGRGGARGSKGRGRGRGTPQTISVINAGATMPANVRMMHLAGAGALQAQEQGDYEAGYEPPLKRGRLATRSAQPRLATATASPQRYGGAAAALYGVSSGGSAMAQDGGRGLPPRLPLTRPPGRGAKRSRAAEAELLLALATPKAAPVPDVVAPVASTTRTTSAGAVLKPSQTGPRGGAGEGAGAAAGDVESSSGGGGGGLLNRGRPLGDYGAPGGGLVPQRGASWPIR